MRQRWRRNDMSPEGKDLRLDRHAMAVMPARSVAMPLSPVEIARPVKFHVLILPYRRRPGQKGQELLEGFDQFKGAWDCMKEETPVQRQAGFPTLPLTTQDDANVLSTQTSALATEVSSRIR
jgi:hypothetical protein